MSNLLKAEFYKQKINGILKMYVIIMFFAGIAISSSSIAAADSVNNDWFWCYNNLLSNSLMINIIIAFMAAFYFVKDFNDKSIQHAIMSDYSRRDVVCVKAIIFNIETILSFLVYVLSGMILIFIIKGKELTGNYNFSIANYILLTLIFKILFLAALNSICMCFCYLLRSAAAYLLMAFALWCSFLGPLYQADFIKNNVIIKVVLKCAINVQDQIMFAGRMGSGAYKITGNEAVFYLSVVVATSFIFYQLTCSILERVEIK